jgi:hypothetical protein
LYSMSFQCRLKPRTDRSLSFNMGHSYIVISLTHSSHTEVKGHRVGMGKDAHGQVRSCKCGEELTPGH